MPALKVPDNWPHYDVIAQPFDRGPQRVSVKSRTFKQGSAYLTYDVSDAFDWLAAVILPSQPQDLRAIYIIPRSVADHHARRDRLTSKTAWKREFRIDEIERLFSRFRDNFALQMPPETGA